MDIRKVKKLIEMLEESGIDEIEIHEDKDSVRVSRNRAPLMQTAAAPLQESRSGAHGENIAFAPEAAANPGASEPTEPEENLVRSPMVGIFYEAQAPGKPSFVELGQTIKKGDILCIIEAMKVMNQVQAERDGIVSRIMVGNGEPVEYGQALFVIREE